MYVCRVNNQMLEFNNLHNINGIADVDIILMSNEQ